MTDSAYAPASILSSCCFFLFTPGKAGGVLVLQAELEPHGESPSLTFEGLLAFNSYFRCCQGTPERQDTPVAIGAITPALFSGKNPEAIYREIAERELGGYSLPSPEMKKAVTLCQARFNQELPNKELYLFGTIGQHDESAEPSRVEARVRNQSYDRWRCVGLRYFSHNYSLVCAIGPSSQGGGISVDLAQERKKFLKDYVEMGARLALMRARLLELQEDWRGIQGQEMDRLHQFHQNLIDFRK